MKHTSQCLVLLLVTFAAAASAVRIHSVAEAFEEETRNFEIPKLGKIELRRDFYPNFTKAIQTLLTDVVLDFFRQVRLQSQVLRNYALSANDQLQHEIQNPSKNKPDGYVNELLHKLNERLKSYLELDPGHQNTTNPMLPSIKNNEDIGTPVAYYCLKLMFSDFPQVMDTQMSHINIIINKLYKEGWKATRKTFSSLQEEFRNEYLNGVLLHTFGTVVQNIFNKREVIEAKVQPETWSQFNTYGSRIEALYKQINPVVPEGEQI